MNILFYEFLMNPEYYLFKTVIKIIKNINFFQVLKCVKIFLNIIGCYVLVF